MKDPGNDRILEEVYGLLNTSPVRYVVLTSGAEVRDDLDRKVFAFYERWLQQEDESRTAIAGFLRDHGFFPGAGSWPLELSHWNYAGAAHLLGGVISRSERLLDRIQELEAELAPVPEVEALMDIAIRTEEGFMEQAKALLAERPATAPQPARIKGTSAAKW